MAKSESKGGDTPAKVTPTKESNKTNSLSKSKTGAEEEEVTAATLQRDYKERTYTARASIIGNPHIKPGMLISIKNVGKKYGGKWWVKSVTHRLDSSGYITELDLQRDALGNKDGVDKGRTDGTVTSPSKKKGGSSGKTPTNVGAKNPASNKPNSNNKSNKPKTPTKKRNNVKVDADTGKVTW